MDSFIRHQIKRGYLPAFPVMRWRFYRVSALCSFAFSRSLFSPTCNELSLYFQKNPYCLVRCDHVLHLAVRVDHQLFHPVKLHLQLIENGVVLEVWDRGAVLGRNPLDERYRVGIVDGYAERLDKDIFNISKPRRGFFFLRVPQAKTSTVPAAFENTVSRNESLNTNRRKSGNEQIRTAPMSRYANPDMFPVT